MVRLLHISDLHFRAKDSWDADPVRNALIEDAFALRSERGAVDLIVVTGDVAFAGVKAEYDLADRWLGALVLRLGVPRERVVLVPGNHDVDRSKITHTGRSLQGTVETASEQVGAEILGSASERKPLLARCQAWLTFAKRWGGGAVPWGARRFPELGAHVAVLSTALLSSGDRDRGRLRLTTYQVREATKGWDKLPIRIAAMHHPPDYLTEADKAAVTPLLNHATVSLRGHLHEPDLAKVIGPVGERLEAAGGSGYAGSAWANAYSLIELDREPAVHLRIWLGTKQRWVPDRNTFPPDGTWPPAPPKPTAPPPPPATSSPPRGSSAPAAAWSPGLSVIYDRLLALSPSKLEELAKRAGVDWSHVRTDTHAHAAMDVAAQAANDDAIAEGLERHVRGLKLTVGLIGFPDEFGAAFDKLEEWARRRSEQVAEVIRILPTDPDARMRAERCDLRVVLVGVRVGGAAGLAVIESLLPSSIAARSWPWDDAATDRWPDDLKAAASLKSKITSTFEGNAIDAVQRTLAQQLDARSPLPPATRASASDEEVAWLTARLPLWIGGHHAALVDRIGKAALKRASLYVPLHTTLHPKERGADAKPEVLTLEAALSRPEHRRVVVIGEAGSGKTVLLQHVAAALALAHVPCDDGDHVTAACALDLAAWSADAPISPIPLLVEAREVAAALNHDQSLEDLLAERLRVPRATLDAGLRNGRYAVLIDSLDEVPTPAARRRVLQALEGCPAVRLVLTSRPGAHTEVDLPRSFARLLIDPLDDELRGRMIERWATVQGYAPDRTQSLADAIAALEHRHATGPGDQPLEANPLMLTCMFLVFHDKDRLPDNTADLYKRMLEILCETRVPRPTEGVHHNDPDDARHASGAVRLQRAKALATVLQRAGVTVLARRDAAVGLRADKALAVPTIDDGEALVTELCATTGIFREAEDGGTIVVRPWHRTFQEYLAASALATSDVDSGSLVKRLGDDGRFASGTWRGCLGFLVGALGQVDPAKAQGAVEALLERASDASPREAGAMFAAAATGAAEYRAESFSRQDALLDRLARAALDRFARDGADWAWQDRVAMLDGVGAIGRDDRFPDPRRDASGWAWLPEWRGAVGGRDEETYGALPPREVAVSGFWMLNRAVTASDFTSFLAETGHPAPWSWRAQLRRPNHPVHSVDFADALAFCRWATRAWALPANGLIDLPTSTEWERAVRHDHGGPWPWGKKPDLGAGDKARASHQWSGDAPRSSTPVGAFPAGDVARSGCQVHDLTGNVWTWTRTVWQDGDKEVDDGVGITTRNVAKVTPGSPRVVRGGSWISPSGLLRASTRLRGGPEDRGSDLGFRVVLRPGSPIEP
jgi:formylglycine-generating enzyme required for sulfatase activity/predicted phosphodiesterase